MLELVNITYKSKNNSFVSKNEKTILSNISLKICNGDIVGIVGESGAGKTTLSKIIAGIFEPTSGELVYSSISKNDVQILFQNSIEIINPNRRVDSLLSDTLKSNKSSIDDLLQTVKLNNNVLKKYAFQLSGGERQRIALARIIATKPKLLIVDEPFSAQDFESQINLMNLLKELNANAGLTILCVSHDLQIISKFTNTLVVMKNGKIIEAGKTCNIVNNPKNNYTKFLFQSAEYIYTT